MKPTITLILSCTLAALAGRPFVVDKIDPAAAGMSPARLARIGDRMKEFVTVGKTARQERTGGPSLDLCSARREKSS